MDKTVFTFNVFVTLLQNTEYEDIDDAIKDTKKVVEAFYPNLDDLFSNSN